MRTLRRMGAVGAGLAAIAIATAAGTPAASAATTRYATTTNAVQAAAGWLAGQFVDSSHLPAAGGDHFDSKYGTKYYPNYGENPDAIFGLAAAKAGGAKVATALGYLATNLDGYTDITNSDGFGPYDGAVAKTALAALVAGSNPSSFAGTNLLRTLKQDECATASTSCTPGEAANIFASVSESFVVLAEARGGAKYGAAYLPSAAAVSYLLSLQCPDGGFTDSISACGASGTPDVDSTSYALMALQALGGHSAEAIKAANWLASQRKAAGYWESQGIPNPNSTGLAAAALQGQGRDVSTSRTWLLGQQARAGSVGAGAVKYNGSLSPTTTSATSLSVLATAQALPALVDGGSLAVLSATGSQAGVAVYAPTASTSAATAKPGAWESVTGVGFAPRERVTVTVHSRPAVVATATSDALGSVRASYKVPSTLTAGRHQLVLTGASSGLTASRSFTVPASTRGSGSTSGSASGGSSGTAGATTTGGAATGATATGGAATGGTTTSSGGTAAAASTDSGSLAATGLDVTRLGDVTVWGGAAVLLGIALTAGARRRRVR